MKVTDIITTAKRIASTAVRHPQAVALVGTTILAASSAATALGVKHQEKVRTNASLASDVSAAALFFDEGEDKRDLQQLAADLLNPDFDHKAARQDKLSAGQELWGKIAEATQAEQQKVEELSMADARAVAQLLAPSESPASKIVVKAASLLAALSVVGMAVSGVALAHKLRPSAFQLPKLGKMDGSLTKATQPKAVAYTHSWRTHRRG